MPQVSAAARMAKPSIASICARESCCRPATESSWCSVSHAIKAGVRLGINASPEPFSNIFVSLIEDGIVAVVIALVLAGLFWIYTARVVRGQVLSIREKEYVEAARAAGASSRRSVSNAP